MGLLDRAIRRGISEGVGKAVSGAIEKAVAPKAEQLASNTARQLDQAAQVNAQQTASGLNSAFSDLQRAAEGYAREMSMNMKICPACGEPTGADKQFCPSCGTKLPVAIQEEQAAQAEDARIMAEWDEKLPQYPKWCFGGKDFSIEESDGYIMFAVRIDRGISAQGIVDQYCELLRQNGFRPAGESPDPSHFYKMVDGVCYHCDTEHCFDGDSDCPIFNFTTGEPIGGFPM